MARPHHRRKHKHFQPPPHERKATKGGAASVMAVFGAILGLAITYFAVQASTVWIIAGLIAGGLLGYFIGRNMDKSAGK